MASFNQNSSGLWAEQYVGARLDYSLDWSDLASAADPLASSVWTCADPALTVTNQLFTGAASTVWFQGTVPDQWYEVVNTVTTVAGRSDRRTINLYVKAGQATTNLRSLLFPNKFAAIAKMKRDRLMMAASGALPTVELNDDYIWDKLRAAEADVGRTLRVPLAPTAFFPVEPTPEEITALNGMPWALDPGYDYSPGDFAFTDKWGFIKLRNKPLISVSRVRFAYPGGPSAFYDLPLDWLRTDKKFGQVQFVPSSTAFAAPINAFIMQAIGNGRTIPLAIQISYVAGLQDAATNFPDLIDAVMKTAALKVIEDAFLPQSGSISADGLSQSMSNDMDKHHDMVDRLINGGKGSNGGLMAAIHGIRFGVM